MIVYKSDFIELARTIFDYIGWINLGCIDHTSYDNVHQRDDFVRWFITLTEQQYIDHTKQNPHLNHDDLMGGTGIGSTGSGIIMSGYTGGTGGILPGYNRPGGVGGAGYDYGLIDNEVYQTFDTSFIKYRLFHNRTYPVIHNLGPNGKFNRTIYKYNSNYIPIGGSGDWQNKRFLLFHVSWDVFNDTKDDYDDYNYEIRMTTVEKINKGLYALTVYYWKLLYNQDININDYLEKKFVRYLEMQKNIETTNQGYSDIEGYGSTGGTPNMQHHHDTYYYEYDSLDQNLYTKSEVGQIIIDLEQTIKGPGL